ncbi:response regulator [Terasakiella sp. A23]|uniref:response regulator n=1 Tax=Terasakiella sp. FCG-A23 TaxID=3080561 RepID=UPI002953DF25|nr:response regulator [Terasakiella sp. A23]MDV7339622.1 response regulator [Terasakiella sp. A23]
MSDDWADDDDFLDDGPIEDGQLAGANSPWVMLIVDDEPGIHDVTKIALKRFSFEGRPLECLSAYSAAEALEILQSRDDIALILLDVVMETDHAGLELARQIRDDLENEAVRIVLRTGQPGQAPEQDVIIAYDINDYRAKTELSSTRLFTTVIGGLRSYRDVLALESYREEAYQMLAENTQSIQSLINLSEAALFQLGQGGMVVRCNQAFADLLGLEDHAIIGFALEDIAPAALLAACDERLDKVDLNGTSYQLKTEETPFGLSGSLS